MTVQAIFHRQLSICVEECEVDEKVCEKEAPRILNDEGEEQEASILNRLKELKEQHYNTLKPYIPEKRLFQVSLVTEGYLETSFMITNLLKVCILALEMEQLPNRTVPSPEHNVKEVRFSARFDSTRRNGILGQGGKTAIRNRKE